MPKCDQCVEQPPKSEGFLRSPEFSRTNCASSPYHIQLVILHEPLVGEISSPPTKWQLARSFNEPIEYTPHYLGLGIQAHESESR